MFSFFASHMFNSFNYGMAREDSNRREQLNQEICRKALKGPWWYNWNDKLSNFHRNKRLTFHIQRTWTRLFFGKRTSFEKTWASGFSPAGFPISFLISAMQFLGILHFLGLPICQFGRSIWRLHLRPNGMVLNTWNPSRLGVPRWEDPYWWITKMKKGDKWKEWPLLWTLGRKLYRSK